MVQFDMSTTSEYIFEFPYHRRDLLDKFLFDINEAFPPEVLSLVIVYVDNTPSAPRVLVLVEFENETGEIQNWIKSRCLTRVLDKNFMILTKESAQRKWISASLPSSTFNPSTIDFLFFFHG